MSFAPEVRRGYVSYSAILRHVGLNREFNINVGPSTGVSMGVTPEELAQREAENDMLFEAVLAELTSLGSLEVISAGKSGSFVADLVL